MEVTESDDRFSSKENYLGVDRILNLSDTSKLHIPPITKFLLMLSIL